MSETFITSDARILIPSLVKTRTSDSTIIYRNSITENSDAVIFHTQTFIISSDSRVILPYLGYEEIRGQLTKTESIHNDFSKTRILQVRFERITSEDD